MIGSGAEGDAPPRPAAARLLSWLGALMLRVLRMTWRTNTAEAKKLDDVCRTGPAIGVFWHGNYLPLFALLAGRSVLVATSDSFRGKVIAGICKSFGYRAVLVGGADHASRTALRTELARPDGLVAIAADGPLGPRHVAKSGLIALAAETGARLIPVAAIAERKLLLSRRWDRMEVPLPTSRVTLRVGDAMEIMPQRAAGSETSIDRVSMAISALCSGGAGCGE